MEALADTVAMMVVMGLCQAEELRLKEEELLIISVTIEVASEVMETALGMVLVHTTCRDGLGELRKVNLKISRN